MNPIKYEVETVFEAFEVSVVRGHCFYTLEQVEEFISKLPKHHKILSIKEYHIVYQHPFVLPAPDGFDEFLQKHVYNEEYKIPAHELQTAKQKSYKQNFIEDDAFNNYCITYEYLEKDTLIDKYVIGHACYDTRKHNRKDTMTALYSHSRSRNYFNLCLLQYRFWQLDKLLPTIKKDI